MKILSLNVPSDQKCEDHSADFENRDTIRKLADKIHEKVGAIDNRHITKVIQTY